MLTRRVIVALLAASAVLFGAAPMAGAAEAGGSTVETRQFSGEGSSSMGLAYYYAYQQALGKAADAGFGDCVLIDSYEWPGGFNVWVLLECTRQQAADR
ncbi:hypothetical protein AB0M91_28850 [Micromonospora rifamycinica]|uniref:hypothetical protein n=2 Tax=Micromonospora rifamycinica TaxID=291594 RepID=UPI00342EB3C4